MKDVHNEEGRRLVPVDSVFLVRKDDVCRIN